MNLLIERHNEAGGYAALKQGAHISTRVCVSVKPQDEILRFVQDTTEISVNGWNFESVPYARFGRVISGGGTVADTLEVILDGIYVADSSYGALTDILKKVVQHPLRGKPIQIGRLVIDTNTYEAIALQPRFVGTIHNSPLSLENGPSMTIKCASYRNAAHRQAAWVHSEVSHKQRWPGDNAAKHMSDAVSRGGQYPWNKTTSSGGGNGGGGGGYPGGYPNFGLGFFNLR